MMAGLCVQQSLLSSHQAVHIHAPYQHLSLKQKTNCLKLHSCKMPIRHACVHLSGVLLAIFCRTSCSVYSMHFPGSMRQEFLQIFCETAASRFNEACLCALGRGSATIIGTTFYDAASRKSILNRSFGGTSSIEEAEYKNEYLAFFCQLPSPAI